MFNSIYLPIICLFICFFALLYYIYLFYNKLRKEIKESIIPKFLNIDISLATKELIKVSLDIWSWKNRFY